MSETVIVKFTDEQCEILLQGLRYVRSSLMLDVRDPTPELDRERKNKLQTIASLVTQLKNATAREMRSVS